MAAGMARIRVKLGQIEVEYEGEPSFLKDDLSPMVGDLIRLYKEHQQVIDSGGDTLVDSKKSDPPDPDGWDHSTNTIATILGSRTGNDLVVAAAAHLSIVQNRDRFSRAELLDEMKSAASFYSASYSNNLSKALETLVKADRLRLVASNTYALSATEKKSIEGRLVNQG